MTHGRSVDALRGWLKRRRSSAPEVEPERSIDAWRSRDVAMPPDAISMLLFDIEQTALGVYAANGLPTRTGHYARGPRGRRWRFIGESLSAEARWTLVLDHPPQDGWRYGTLEDLGAHETGKPDVRAAADLLAGCSGLRSRLRDRGPTPLAEDLEAAIRLGAEWQLLLQARAWKDTSRLKLTAPRPARRIGRKAP